MALFLHGYRRFTEDVDILVNAEGLHRIHQSLEGLGYIPPFAGSKNLRDAETGVRVEFLVTGQFPGDGQPKSLAFPEPLEAGVPLEGMSVLDLPPLVELKLASGMVPGRRKDLGDVQELIRLWNLPLEYGDKLNNFVRDLYRELWKEVQDTPPHP